MFLLYKNISCYRSHRPYATVIGKVSFQDYIVKAKAMIDGNSINDDVLHSLAFNIMAAEKNNETEIMKMAHENELNLTLTVTKLEITHDMELAKNQAYFLKKLSFLTMR